MPLYTICVGIDFDMVVQAEDKERAFELAKRHVLEELENQRHRFEFALADVPVPAEWRDCYPYGSDGKRTVAEILEEESKR